MDAVVLTGTRENAYDPTAGLRPAADFHGFAYPLAHPIPHHRYCRPFSRARVVKDPRSCLRVTISGSLHGRDRARTFTYIHMSRSHTARVTFTITPAPPLGLPVPIAFPLVVPTHTLELRVTRERAHAKTREQLLARRRPCVSASDRNRRRSGGSNFRARDFD